MWSSGRTQSSVFTSKIYLPAQGARSHGSCCFRLHILLKAFGDNISLHPQVTTLASAYEFTHRWVFEKSVFPELRAKIKILLNIVNIWELILCWWAKTFKTCFSEQCQVKVELRVCSVCTRSWGSWRAEFHRDHNHLLWDETGKEPLGANFWQVKQKALLHLSTKGREASDVLWAPRLCLEVCEDEEGPYHLSELPQWQALGTVCLSEHQSSVFRRSSAFHHHQLLPVIIFICEAVLSLQDQTSQDENNPGICIDNVTLAA